MGLAASGAAADAACDKVASPLGSDAYPGTVAEPYATVDKLANSLSPGQTGCLRSAVYQGDVKVNRGGVQGAPTTITSYPGERATVVGRFRVAEPANFVTVTSLDLDGRNAANLPSPTINGDHVTFAANDVTNHHTMICFILGSDTYGRAHDTVIERNRIHNCGRAPGHEPSPRDLRGGLGPAHGSPTTGSTTTPTAVCSSSRTRRTPTSRAT